MLYKLFSALLLCLFTYSCQPVTFETSRPVIEIPGELVYVLDNDLYVDDGNLENSTRLTNSPESLKTNPVWHPTEDRFAFLDENGTPVIMNTDGQTIETLSQWTNVRDLGWSTNGATLYVLVNNQELEFFGPEMDVPSFGIGLGFGENVLSVAVNGRNELAFTFPGGYAVRSNDPGFTTISRLGSALSYTDASFAINNDDIVTINVENIFQYLQLNVSTTDRFDAIVDGDIRFLKYIYENGQLARYAYSVNDGIATVNLTENRLSRSALELNNNGRFVQMDYR